MTGDVYYQVAKMKGAKYTTPGTNFCMQKLTAPFGVVGIPGMCSEHCYIF